MYTGNALLSAVDISLGMLQMTEDGWRQIRAGLTLVTWSKLAFWSVRDLVVIPAKEDDFESACAAVHPDFGRLICWIAFGVGSEYLVRGVFMLKGHDPTSKREIVRPPAEDEDITDWVMAVKSNCKSVKEPEDVSGMNFGSDLPWSRILEAGPDLDLVSASTKLLAVKIRNRDAHRYTESVRAFHFHAVERLFVPALNIVLRSLNQTDLRTCLIGANLI